MRRHFIWAVCGIGFAVLPPALAQDIPAPPVAPAPKPLPPSPFGEDPHGAFNWASNCWVWNSGKPRNPDPVQDNNFTTQGSCAGKPLDGEAVVQWDFDSRHRGETWKGQFHEGRFTGTATRQFSDARYEAGYVDGLRSGRSILNFAGGGHLEQNFKDDLLDGPDDDVYAEGARLQGRYEKGKQVGNIVETFPDGSRFEHPVLEGPVHTLPEGAWFAPDGTRQTGNYVIPHADVAGSPPLSYPKIAVRLGEQGTVSLVFKVLQDGSVRDVKLARTSGSQRLDDAAVTQIATWHFFPATIDGKPVESYVLFRQIFHLRS